MREEDKQKRGARKEGKGQTLISPSVPPFPLSALPYLTLIFAQLGKTLLCHLSKGLFRISMSNSKSTACYSGEAEMKRSSIESYASFALGNDPPRSLSFPPPNCSDRVSCSTHFHTQLHGQPIPNFSFCASFRFPFPHLFAVHLSFS